MSARPATTRLKVNPPLGQLPVLQYCAPDQLEIDEGYQRSLAVSSSQSLIRRIAMHWDWGLCQPLFVARRADGKLYVVDGQHRLAAAKLRPDIWQLPCVVASFDSASDEAAAFVSLNQQRQPLSKLSLFKAALAAGDFEASQILIAVDEAGLQIASSSNLGMCPPGSLSNIGGMQNCYRVHGLQVLTAALDVLAQSYKGQELRYAGSIFPGIATIVADELKRDANFADGERFCLLTEMIGGAEQVEWYKDLVGLISREPTLTRKVATARVFRAAWDECTAEQMDEAA